MRSSNFKQAFWLGFGQLLTFTLSFVSAAILSRYFDKMQYGTYRQILYVYTTLNLLFAMGLPSVFAYFIPRLKTGQQKHLIKGLNIVFIILGLVFSIVLFVLAKPISIWFENPDLALGLKIFSPFPLFTLPALGVEGIYTAIRKTRDIALYHIVSKVLMLICIVGPVVYFHTTYIGAILGWGLASFMSFLYAMYLKNRPYAKIKDELVPNMYKTIFDYSLPLMGAFVFGFVINAADQFYVSHFYGTETFAVYSNGCFSIPIVAMVATSVKNILLPLFSKADSENNFESVLPIYNNAVYESVKIIFPFLIFCMLFATYLTVFIYGEKYEESGMFLRAYILRDFIDVFPYLSVLLALGKSRFYMWSHLFGAIYVWIIDYIIVKHNLSAFWIVLVATSLQFIIRFVSFSYIKKISGFNFFVIRNVVKILAVICHSLICVIPAYLFSCKWLHYPNSFLILLIGGGLFYSLLIVSGRIIKIDYLTSIKLLINKKD